MSELEDLQRRVEELLAVVYRWVPNNLAPELVGLAERYRFALRAAPPVRRFDQRSAFLITYADSVQRAGEVPLRALGEVVEEHVGDLVTDIHLLPFFPWTSDDGFGVVDHRSVNPAVGEWDDVHALRRHHDLAFDFVANHTSASSPWFVGWLAGLPGRRGFYIEQGDHRDVSQVVRPRTTPLFHDYEAPDGTVRSAWTTFGADQVDVNVGTPAVLVELTEVLLSYLAHGATTVRLDAIGYLVKESGTSCIHLPATHAIVQLWRALVDHARPGARLLTETNVPHADNISYFGDGTDEAHMVYQFALPPLVLHSFVAGDTGALSRWAATVGPVSDSATWFNFLASHDGIGLRPTQGLLTEPERQALADRVLAHGGQVSLADQPDGSTTVYELNISYLDALCTPQEAADDATFARKAVAAHNILLSVVGVPAIYVHSLLGSRSDLAAVAESGIARRINRAVLDADELDFDLATQGRRRQVLDGITGLLRRRREVAAFSPWCDQEVLELDPRVFAVRRTADDGSSVVSLTNVTGEAVTVPWEGAWRDLLDGTSGAGAVTLQGYDVLWLSA
ncbi:alpha-amylase family glycosyl hydrolase [Ornithinimicrobium pekingense]|uniref:Sucrose phosphorylase n=1 Tax=Ornithinimicrobium pekingense TaxID=384677 RepID=A0ABQ2F4A4_9MICO|nr:alpha-amylase family glycosyl hydrolase [Ornithinimicrobium pekingense]GGK60673.1 sucrose phosphorylase [Ornithinimicrobium pekingense]